MYDYFTSRQTWKKEQCVAYIGQCIEGDTLEYWKFTKHRFSLWEEVKDSIRENYGNHYKLDRAFNEISDLK